MNLPKMNDSLKKASKIPLAYQKGYQDFYGRDFVVTSDVLIPRPETEQLIDEVLILVGKPFLKGVKPSKPLIKDNIKIVDVGTGSGVIAITLKEELKTAEVYATDISEAAIKIAKKNAANHGTHISFVKSYLLKNIKVKPDLVVANLPYVDEDWDFLDKEALSFEPSLALFAEDHGLKLIKELIDEVSEIKVPFLILEADPIQHQDIIKYAGAHHYSHLKSNGFTLVFKFQEN